MSGARVIVGGNARPALKAALESLKGDRAELMLRDIGEYLVNSTRERARRHVSPSGQRWQPLSPAYKAYKQRKRPGKPILEFDFHMLGDMFSAHPEGTTLLVGTNAVYGATHQFGRGKIPARPFLGLSDADLAEIDLLVEDHLDASFPG